MQRERVAGIALFDEMMVTELQHQPGFLVIYRQDHSRSRTTAKPNSTEKKLLATDKAPAY
ncbi:hypothetical protein E2C01_033023 [Portunus trituberculatus]|uniref:Uncharacterized protein n=1 Tax=Portunus trituberculatus TaxID=210409 RepID=A0A5B7F1B3_PORTR|nr:hypothetical protein [Portunus trituberculatus]